ncbi:MAG TPA: FAD-dependent monooxygenase [Pseudolabrys sp.]|jgi:2-polyprenyl-6-methoxyphenol hydroxylase-like FAD-dependent oxidoreductase
MRIAILGAGPAGLYLAYLIKRRRADADITVFEQNPAGATFGFGVVFSDRALEFLREDDPETFAAITPQMESWDDITLMHKNERVVIDGVGFAAIGRLKLLQLLQERVRAVGIKPEFSCAVTSLDEFDGADLIVGADGANSLVRRTFADAFGAAVTYGANRFAWFGTPKVFDTLTQTFRHTPIGDFNAHHYRYAPGRSTFIVEVDDPTFARAGFERTEGADSRALCEKVFADALDGKHLVSNNSIWRRFPHLSSARWHHGKHVLIGDAAHTAHFSIGSGTRLAMEDAIALDKALAAHGDDVAAALPAYEAARRPIVDKIVTGADASAGWYENFAEYMELAPLDFAMSYVMRSGRIDIERLRKLSPRFVERYEREKAI